MSYSQLTYEQRYLIYKLLKIGFTQTKIAEQCGVHRSTISRELKRNTGKRGFRFKQAHRMAQQRLNKAQKRVTLSDWALIDQHLELDFSPEQTSHWVLDNYGIKVSPEWIYQHIWEDKRQGGKLYEHLRRKKKYRKRSQKGDNRGKIPNQRSIEERPEIVDARVRVGDWEADTIIGKNMKGAIVTLVDRKSRFVRLGLVKQRTKEEVEEKIIALLMGYPVHTITFDNGKEFAGHEKISQALGVDIFFAHTYASWERGTNENTNGLIRQYIPKDTDFRKLTFADICFVENRLNFRPRKCLDFFQPMVILKNLCCT